MNEHCHARPAAEASARCVTALSFNYTNVETKYRGEQRVNFIVACPGGKSEY